MSCPTCDHTMEGLGYCDGGMIFHCERCGTVTHAVATSLGPNRVYVPRLVDRCRRYEDMMRSERADAYQWRRIGIAESINVPGKRGTP